MAPIRISLSVDPSYIFLHVSKIGPLYSLTIRVSIEENNLIDNV